MNLIEINSGFQINVGAPEPILIANGNFLSLSFYIESDDEKTCTLLFRNYNYFRLGMPGNETLYGHPYKNLGLESHSFFELRDSDLIKNLRNISSVHPRHNPNNWLDMKHFILTFHDNMFECVAQDFEIKEGNASIYNQLSVTLDSI